MAKPRKERLTRKASEVGPEEQAVGVATLPSTWTHDPRPLVPPLKTGREWEQVRRIAYL